MEIQIQYIVICAPKIKIFLISFSHSFIAGCSCVKHLYINHDTFWFLIMWSPWILWSIVYWSRDQSLHAFPASPLCHRQQRSGQAVHTQRRPMGMGIANAPQACGNGHRQTWWWLAQHQWLPLGSLDRQKPSPGLQPGGSWSQWFPTTSLPELCPGWSQPGHRRTKYQGPPATEAAQGPWILQDRPRSWSALSSPQTTCACGWPRSATHPPLPGCQKHLVLATGEWKPKSSGRPDSCKHPTINPSTQYKIYKYNV